MMSFSKLGMHWKAALLVAVIVAANAATVATVTGVSYAQSDSMMHDYSSMMMN